MYHGLLFNTDGEVVEIPGQPMIPRHARVRTYPVVDRCSWISMGAGQADESLFPSAVGPHDPNYLMFSANSNMSPKRS